MSDPVRDLRQYLGHVGAGLFSVCNGVTARSIARHSDGGNLQGLKWG